MNTLAQVAKQWKKRQPFLSESTQAEIRTYAAMTDAYAHFGLVFGVLVANDMVVGTSLGPIPARKQ